MKNDLFGPMTNNCLYPPALLFSLRTTDSLSGMQVKAAVSPLGTAFSSRNGVSDFAEKSFAFLQISGRSGDRLSLHCQTFNARKDCFVSPTPNMHSASPNPNAHSVSPNPNMHSASPNPNARSVIANPNARSVIANPKGVKQSLSAFSAASFRSRFDGCPFGNAS